MAHLRQPPKPDDDVFALRPNAAVSVIRAAKASLKEPTRPQTPSEFSRQLFTTGYDDAGQNRPTSSYGLPQSKHFFDGGPKLGLPRMDPTFGPGPGTSRSILEAGSSSSGYDQYGASGSRGSLQRAGSQGSFANPDTSNSPLKRSSYHDDFSFAGGAAGAVNSPGQLQRSSSSRNARMTAAETVAALKASIAAVEIGASEHVEVGDPLPPWAESPKALPEEALDPRRNDDLPPRPGTSRGRPSTAPGKDSDSYPGDMSEYYGGGMPAGTVDLGNGSQMLDLSSLPQYSDSSSDDESAPGSYARPLSGVSTASSAAAAGASASGAASASGQGAAQAAAAVVLDPSEEFYQWRTSVETSLQQVSGSTAGAGSREGLARLLQHCATLSAHVEHMRQQPQASKWLNSSSAAYKDASGTPLTMREAISEHVFRLVDSSSPELLLKACSIVLRVCRSRQPLLQAGKLLYRLSKDTMNDALFRREGVLEPVLRTVHIMVASTSKRMSGGGGGGGSGGGSSSGTGANTSSMHEPLVFLNGVLKNVSNDASNQKALMRFGALQVVSGLLAQLTQQVEADARESDSACQVAVQATGVLRNLAVPAPHAPSFAVPSVLQPVLGVLRVMGEQQEVVLNLGRVLSKLSLDEQCQAAIEAEPAFGPLLVRALDRFRSHRAVLLRLAFVLGNLTTTSNAYREQLAGVPGFLNILVNVLQQYTAPATAAPAAGEGSGSSKADKLARAATREDCLIKVLRLAANLAIHPEVGPRLAERNEVADALVGVLESYSYAEAEEVVLNAVCALTNLSFYQTRSNKLLALEPAVLLRHVTPLLLGDNAEAIIEAARAYGNFSRSADAREYMVQARVVEALVLLLDHSNSEVLYSVCGTLINFTADAARKHALLELGGASRLMELLERMAAMEEPTSMEVSIVCVVCKALFNVCAEEAGSAAAGRSTTPQPAPIPEEERVALEELLEHVAAAFEPWPEVPQLTTRLMAQLRKMARAHAAGR